MKNAQSRRLKFLVTVGSLSLIAAHLAFPDAKIDLITVCLLALAVLPWFQSLFKSVELPGGLKLEFHDLKRIEEEAKSSGIIIAPANEPTPERTTDRYSFQQIDLSNPALALMGFRMELEKTLRQIAAKYGKDNQSHRSIKQIIRSLGQDQLLTPEEVSTIDDTIQTLNAASHGVEYDERTADWIMQVAPRILDGLRNRVEFRGGQISHANPDAQEHWIDKSFRETSWTTNAEWGSSISAHRDLWLQDMRNTYAALEKLLEGEPAQLLKDGQENWERQIVLDQNLLSSLLPRLLTSIGREGQMLAAMNRMNRIRERALELEDYLDHLRG